MWWRMETEFRGNVLRVEWPPVATCSTSSALIFNIASIIIKYAAVQDGRHQRAVRGMLALLPEHVCVRGRTAFRDSGTRLETHTFLRPWICIQKYRGTVVLDWTCDSLGCQTGREMSVIAATPPPPPLARRLSLSVLLCFFPLVYLFPHFRVADNCQYLRRRQRGYKRNTNWSGPFV